MKKHEQAQHAMRLLGGRRDIETITQIFDKTQMFADVSESEMVWEYKKERARKWLRGIRVDIPLNGGDVVHVRGCHNIKRYRSGLIVNEYVLLDFMSPDELYSVIRQYEAEAEARYAIAKYLKLIIPEQLRLNL